MRYYEVKTRQQKEFEAFPMAFAYSKSQLAEGLEKLGVAQDEICTIGGGGFIRGSDKDAFITLIDRLDAEMAEHMKDFDFLVSAFTYELSNHEYRYTWDPTDAILALGFTVEEVQNDERLSKALDQARKKQGED